MRSVQNYWKIKIITALMVVFSSYKWCSSTLYHLRYAPAKVEKVSLINEGKGNTVYNSDSTSK